MSQKRPTGPSRSFIHCLGHANECHISRFSRKLKTNFYRQAIFMPDPRTEESSPFKCPYMFIQYIHIPLCPDVTSPISSSMKFHFYGERNPLQLLFMEVTLTFLSHLTKSNMGPSHHRMAHSWVADGGESLQIWRVAVNLLYKQLWAADKGRSCSLWVRQEANNSP